MKQIVNFIKKETILVIAWILAIISAFAVHPSIAYIDYIDFKSLGTLWSLMVIMEGCKQLGIFKYVGELLLSKTSKVWQLVLVLVMLCFFFSMFITNDVALLTFVPFAIYMLDACNRIDLLIPVIVLQTIAANLGSMLTPVGNPQNLYLYGISNMALGDFLLLMLPYTVLTFVFLLINIVFMRGKNEILSLEDKEGETEQTQVLGSTKEKGTFIIYVGLFLMSLLTVAHIIPFYFLVAAVFICVMIMDRNSIFNIDYALLLTFVGFFVFTGNLGSIEMIRNFFVGFVTGNEFFAGIITSQLISNVPAALLLADFSSNINELILGVNIGGLGTLIASMASLISYKLLAHNYNEIKGKYFIRFTLMNILYLVILILFWKINVILK